MRPFVIHRASCQPRLENQIGFTKAKHHTLSGSTCDFPASFSTSAKVMSSKESESHRPICWSAKDTV